MIVAFRAFDKEFIPIVEKTSPNHTEYCKRHGYLLAELIMDSIQAENRIEYFKKTEWKWYEEILKIFNRPGVEWVWFMGMDCLIMNMGIKLEEIICTYQGEIIVSSDQEGLSTHSTLFKNSHNVRQFLLQMLQERNNYENAQYYFQKNRHHSFITVVPQRVMNSYDREARLEPEGTPGSFEAEDFILHFTCMENEKRLERIEKWKGEVMR